MILTPGRKSDRIIDPVRKVGKVETAGNMVVQGFEEGLSSFGYTTSWLNNALFQDEESQEYLEIQKKRKLDIYNEINAYEADQDYGAVASTLAGISRGVIGGIANPYELAIGVASGGLGGAVATGIGKVGGGTALKFAGSFATETLADTIYNASVSEGALTGDYNAYDFANDFVNGAVFAGVLNGGSKVLGKGFQTSKGYVESKLADRKTKQDLGITEEAQNAVQQANSEKIAKVESVIETAENLTGKKVSDEALAEVIKPDYDTSKLDSMTGALEEPEIAESLKRYKILTEEIKSGKKNMTPEVMDRLEADRLKIREIESSSYIPGNDDTTLYINALMADNDIQTNSKEHLFENLEEVSRDLERLQNSNDEAEIAEIMSRLEKHDREVKLIQGDPNFKDIHKSKQEIKAREVTSLKDMDRIERQYKTVTNAKGEKVQVRKRSDEVKVTNWKQSIMEDMGFPKGVKFKDFEGYIPRKHINDLRTEGEGPNQTITKTGGKWYSEPAEADVEFTYKGDTYFWKGAIDPETGKWVGETFVARNAKELKPLPKVGEAVKDTPEIQRLKESYKKTLDDNGIDAKDLHGKFKEFYELENKLNEHLQAKLGEGASLETYMNELDNLNKAELKVDDKKLSELVTRQNTEADLGYKESDVEIDNKMKYNEEAIKNDPDLKSMSDDINRALSEGEFESSADSKNTGIMAYIMCKIGG